MVNGVFKFTMFFYTYQIARARQHRIATIQADFVPICVIIMIFTASWLPGRGAVGADGEKLRCNTPFRANSLTGSPNPGWAINRQPFPINAKGLCDDSQLRSQLCRRSALDLKDVSSPASGS